MVSIVEHSFPCFFMPTENIPVILNYISFQCAGSDEQLGKLVYNALKQLLAALSCCMSGSFSGTKKWAHSLPVKQKEKIDKCKKQVGIQDGSLTERTNLEFKAMTNKVTQCQQKRPRMRMICSTRGDGGRISKCFQTLLPLSELPERIQLLQTSFLSSY